MGLSRHGQGSRYKLLTSQILIHQNIALIILILNIGILAFLAERIRLHAGIKHCIIKLVDHLIAVG